MNRCPRTIQGSFTIGASSNRTILLTNTIGEEKSLIPLPLQAVGLLPGLGAMYVVQVLLQTHIVTLKFKQG